MASREIPPGFTRLVVQGSFRAELGTFYTASREGKHIVAIRAEAPHANSAGYVHGGFLLALAELALSHGRGDVQSAPHATLSVSANFLRPAKVGDWLEAHVEVQKSSQSLVFADVFILVGERKILHATGLLKPAEVA